MSSQEFPIKRLISLMARLDEPNEGSLALIHINKLLTANNQNWRSLILHIEEHLQTFAKAPKEKENYHTNKDESAVNFIQKILENRDKFSVCIPSQLPSHIEGFYVIRDRISVGSQNMLIYDIDVFNPEHRLIYELTVSDSRGRKFLETDTDLFIAGRVSRSSNNRGVIFVD